MRHASGSAVTLSYGRYQAEIVTVGACLRSLTRDGLNLVAGTPAGEMCADFRGAVLMPWPNRVGDGAYEFGDETHRLALSEPERRNALHGLAHWVPWTVADHTADRVVLGCELAAQVGYPWSLDLEADYRLTEVGLTVRLSATNVGERPAPYGVGHHPYFTLGLPADELELSLPAGTWCPADERGLPGEARPVDGTPYDFGDGRRIGELVLDHPFGDLDGGAVRLSGGDRAITLTLGESCRWVHVFTGDSHDPPRRAVALEPMSCPPDAFRSGTDLEVLEPGATHRLDYTITGS